MLQDKFSNKKAAGGPKFVQALDGAKFQCIQFLPFLSIFFIPFLSRSYFTPNKIEQLFYFLFKFYNLETSMSTVGKSASRKKWVSLAIIQPPFNEFLQSSSQCLIIAFQPRDCRFNDIPREHKNRARVTRPFPLRAGDAIHPVLRK